MESFVNQPFLEKRTKWAKWGSYVGFAALFIGLMMTNRSLLLSYAFLLVGLFGASLGSFLSSRYVREPRADQVLSDALESLDKRYTLYSYYLAANHIVASHYGLVVIVRRSHGGEVTFDDKGRWRHKAGWRKVFQLFGEPSVGKPHQEAVDDVEWTKKWIDEVFPEDDLPVNGIIVFTDPEVQLNAKKSPVPAVKAGDLARYMKQGLKGQPTLTTAKQKELRRTLDEIIAES